MLGVSRSGYYASRSKSKLAIENEVISVYIKLTFNEHHGRYECRRIKSALFNNYGLVLSRKRITRLIRAMGLYARGSNYKYKYKKSRNNLSTTNLINQVFIA